MPTNLRSKIVFGGEPRPPPRSLRREVRKSLTVCLSLDVSLGVCRKLRKDARFIQLFTGSGAGRGKETGSRG